MKLSFALLLMTTAFGAGGAVLAAGQSLSLAPDASRMSRTGEAPILIDDDEEGRGGWLWSWTGRGHDDDDDECEDDDDEGGQGCAGGAAGNAARAGTVAPPKNGLFTDGTAPAVQSN